MAAEASAAIASPSEHTAPNRKGSPAKGQSGEREKEQ